MAIFICKHCDTKFVKEKNFNTHNRKCEQKKRAEWMETITGKTAFKYYIEWRKCRNFSEPVIETFMISKFFNCFIEFVKYVKNMNIPEPKEYIRFMANKGILPEHWYTDGIYVEYIEYFDLSRSPRQQVQTTFETLTTIARIMDCEISEVLNNIRPGQMIKLLQARKLSPWVLLFTEKFHNFLSNKITEEQGIFIQNFIDPVTWQKKFMNNPELINEIKQNIQNFKL